MIWPWDQPVVQRGSKILVCLAQSVWESSLRPISAIITVWEQDELFEEEEERRGQNSGRPSPVPAWIEAARPAKDFKKD